MPENIDVLLVEQEVVGTDESALAAVVAADVELTELRLEEKQLVDAMSAEEHASDFDADAAGERLNEIYERMAVMGSSTAEARASKILHGLGELGVYTSMDWGLWSALGCVGVGV